MVASISSVQASPKNTFFKRHGMQQKKHVQEENLTSIIWTANNPLFQSLFVAKPSSSGHPKMQTPKHSRQAGAAKAGDILAIRGALSGRRL
jgi:hypothetical protein